MRMIKPDTNNNILPIFLTINETLLKYTALFMFCHHNKSPTNVFNKLFLTTDAKKWLPDFKSNAQVIPIFSNTAVGQQSVKFYSPKVWNKIPKQIRSIKSNSIKTSFTIDYC